MKKFFLSLTGVIGMVLCSQAQIKFGIKAGGNVSNQHNTTAEGTKLISRNAFRGYHAGIVVDVKLSENVYIQPQLLYTKKGANYITTANKTETQLTTGNIELPVNLLYKKTFPLGKLFAGIGPVINYGISGKLNENGTTSELYNAMKNWKRLDVSANALAGIEFRNGFFASMNYQMGLIDVNKTSGTQAKNRSLSVSIGYLASF